jgi:hypothetical protein
LLSIHSLIPMIGPLNMFINCWLAKLMFLPSMMTKDSSMF